MARRSDCLVLFDVDGTLTKPRGSATEEMLAFLKELRSQVVIGVVGGSDLKKQKEQLGDNCLEMFDFFFPENGLAAYKQGLLFSETSFKDHLGEEKMQRLINFCLRYIADLDIPIKRGTFIEFRKGMLNVSPIGRNCSQSERDDYEKFDLANGIRKAFIARLKEEFADFNLRFSIGGQISFDIFPEGWDKTYCLRFLDTEPEIKEVHFFGDKTFEGGNDYEIFTSDRTIGHSVTCPEDTMRMCKELFMA
mmetsp:Transcript_84204/g.225163  ORF Transcript_84204/g.225163 Transcript_84204/m.225163 type:complete len:249 (-) Transcript_84204:101-847(-)